MKVSVGTDLCKRIAVQVVPITPFAPWIAWRFNQRDGIVIRPADISIHGAILVISPSAIGLSDTNMLHLQNRQYAEWKESV